MRRRDDGMASRGGFSLVELLTVVALLGLLAAIMVPSFNSMAGGSAIIRAGQSIGDQLAFARQTATTKNASVELRLIEDTPEGAGNQEPGFVAMQVWEFDQKGENARPLKRIEFLPEGVIINPALSPLLDVSSAIESGRATFGATGERNYKSIRIRANGRIEADVALANSCLTAQLKRDDRQAPKNFYTIQINPLTGRVTAYRP